MAKSKIARSGDTKTPPAGVVKTTTPVRNTPIPKISPAPRKEITHEMISQRAYEIFTSGSGGSEVENWLRAERELKGL
jgi:hypothetical protein